MELFTKLFGSLLVFVYHCFDRIVIHGYLSALMRPEQVVYFFRNIVGVQTVDKEVLSRRTGEYQDWVEAFARNHDTPIEWAEKGVRKEDYVQRWLRPLVRAQRYGVYFIFKSMEQGPTFRCTVPKYPTRDPHHRILAPQRSRFTHYYFYIRDEALGPIAMRVASFFPFQTTYYLNGHSFIEQELNRTGIGFRKNDNAFLAVDDVSALQAAADRLNPALIRERLDYWTLLLGPKFSTKERERISLRRFYAISQIEYCRNFIFKRNFPIHRIFERQLRVGIVALVGRQDFADLRHSHHQEAARQAQHHPRADRARAPYLSRLLEARVHQAVREVRHLPAQRGLLEQPGRLRTEEGARTSGRRAREVPGHHRALRHLPGPLPERAGRLPAFAAPRTAHYRWQRQVSRHQRSTTPA